MTSPIDDPGPLEGIPDTGDHVGRPGDDAEPDPEPAPITDREHPDYVSAAVGVTPVDAPTDTPEEL